MAYVSNAESKEIFAFDMDPESGRLSLIERVPVPGTDLPSPTSLPMAVSPDHRFLYAALRSTPFAASSFSIDPSSGRLSHLHAAALRHGVHRHRPQRRVPDGGVLYGCKPRRLSDRGGRADRGAPDAGNADRSERALRHG
jgi:Lactonase, 7-bladed beta-propeller